MGLPVALLCACLWGAFASAHPALDVTYQIDEVYALGVHATFSAGVPPNTTLSWRRADGQGAPVAIGLQAGATQARLLRFTPKQEYIFTLSAGTAAAGGRAVPLAPAQNLTIPASGIADFDADSPFVELVSGELPSFELLVFDTVDGLTAVDREGWVVWYSLADGSAWDQLPYPTDGSAPALVSLAQSGAHVEVNSGMQLRLPTGELLANVTQAQLSHEAHLDRTDVSHVSALSLLSETKTVSGLNNTQDGDALVQWDVGGGSSTVSRMADMFDYFDPRTDRGRCSDDGSLCGPPPATRVSSSGVATGSDDWTHCNAAARGSHGNYIVSARHLSAVVSFKIAAPCEEPAGAHAKRAAEPCVPRLELDFVMSSEVRSSLFPNALHFTYDKESSKQYNQHCVRQLPNGNILLFDNGDVRPDAQLDAKGRFTRLAEYQLDRDAGVAKLVWEFRPMLNATRYAYSFHAGAVARLTNGHTVGGFSCDNELAGAACTHMVYVADAHGAEVARIRVPAPQAGDDDEASVGGFGYRALPLGSLAGEQSALFGSQTFAPVMV